jgi:hypothetical protein
MITYLNALFEANFYLLLFVGFYWIFLRKEKRYLLNRILLISFIPISFLIPHLSVPVRLEKVVQTFTLPEVSVIPDASHSSGETLSLMEGLGVIYLIGVLVSVLLFLRELKTLIRLFKRNDASARGIFSFMGYLFWNAEVPEENRSWVMKHEHVHMREYHTVDLLFVRLTRIISWFNPAVYFLENLIEENHEYRADSVVARTREEIYTYSNVLLGQAMGVGHSAFVHQFSKPNLLKRRIQMLHKKERPSWVKYTLLAPLLIMAVVIHGCTKESEPSSPAENTEVPKSSTENEEIYQVTEVPPQFKGGQDALIAYMQKHIVYPEAAKADAVEGSAFVEFSVDTGGSVGRARV